MVLEALMNRMDGVAVLGCHFGDCHYITGNYYTERRMKAVRAILEYIEVEPDRLLVDWVSAAEGERFATIVRDFTEKIRSLGPLGGEAPFREVRDRLLAAREALGQQRLRWLVGKEKEMVEEGNVFEEDVSQEEFDRVMVDSLRKEYLKNRILLTVSGEALSAREVAHRLKVSPREVLSHLIALERNGLVSVAEVSETSPKYRRLGE